MDIWLDIRQPLETRIDDLISRMTRDEKISQLLHASAPIERFGIKAYNWWNECLHGVSGNGRATVFPQAIGLAATFDEDLLRRVASAISDEARAKYNYLRKTGDGTLGKRQGLTFWAPNVNIFRDPRWGRGQETYGEDPFLTSRLGVAFIRGLQGDDETYLKTAACAKHYAVHSGPEGERHRFDAVVSLKDLYETYLPAFRAAVVEAGVEAVMGAYNRMNHEPCCASRLLLDGILRGEWGFRGHVVSDCWAIRDFHEHHKTTAGPDESAALALNRGCDLNCGCTYDSLNINGAIAKGLVSDREIDRALRRLLSTRFRLGMFDPDDAVPFSTITTDVIRSEAHEKLAYEAAVKSMVLLKNRDNILPLDPSKGSIYITGPNAADISVLLGNYFGVSDRLVTALEGIVGAAGPGLKVDYKKGCLLAHRASNPVNWAPGDAAKRDAVVAVMGFAPELESEEGDALDSPLRGDRGDILLPECQLEYLRSLCATGTPVVLVLCGGSSVALGDVADKVAAILHIWYPGQEGGRALADILFGNAVPSGRLSITFPESVDQLPPFDDYSMDGRTYRFMKAKPLFPFGFGLSYTTFSYGVIGFDKNRVTAGESIVCSVTVTNTGRVRGEEVVQAYLTDLEASVRVPSASLCGFRRIDLEPGASKTVEFVIRPEMMETIGEDGKPNLEPGAFRVTVGGASPGERSGELGVPMVSAGFTVM